MALLVAAVSAAWILSVYRADAYGEVLEGDSYYIPDSVKFVWNDYASRGEYDSLIGSAREFYAESMEKGDISAAIYARASMGQAFAFLENVDSVESCIRDINRHYVKGSDYLLEVFIHLLEGSYALKYDLDYSDALKSYEEGYHSAVRGDDTRNQIVMLANIVNIFYVRSDKYGMDYAEKAISIAEELPEEDHTRCVAYISMAQMFILSGNYQEAKRYLELSSGIDDAYSFAIPITYLLWATLSEAEGDYGKSERYYEKALASATSSEPAILSKIYLEYGRWNEKRNDYDEAISLYQKGLELSEHFKNLEFRMELLHRLFVSYSMVGNENMAMNYYREISKFMNFVKDRDREFYALQRSVREMEYYEELQTREIHLLRVNRRYIIAISALLIIAVIAVTVYILYVRKNRMYTALVLQHRNYARQLEIKERVQEEIVEGNGEMASDEDIRYREIFSKLEALMRVDKIYHINDLSLDQIAQRLSTNRTYLSKSINKYAGVDYYSYVDRYRINEARRDDGGG